MVGDISFQKMYGLFGLKHQILDISGDAFGCGINGQPTREDRASQLLIWETLSLAILCCLMKGRT